MPKFHRVAVIGSNSFSGGDLIDLLLADPDRRVLGISRSAEKGPLYLPYLRWNDGRFSFQQFDLNRHSDEILAALDRFEPEAIVNFAAQSEVAPSWQHPEHWFQTNVVALARLLNPLKDRPYLKRYVHISSPEVYGACVGQVTEQTPMNPSTPYAASKAAADFFLSTLVKNFNFPLVTIRATNVYGAHQQLWKIIPRSVIYLLTNQRISLHGGGMAVKSYIHIRDVSRGELLAMEQGLPGRMYHLSPEGGYEVREVVRRICGLLGRDFERSTVSAGERLGQDAAYVIDSSRARQELGWRPEINLDQGLREVVAWVDEHWKEICTQPLEYRHAA